MRYEVSEDRHPPDSTNHKSRRMVASLSRRLPSANRARLACCCALDSDVALSYATKAPRYPPSSIHYLHHTEVCIIIQGKLSSRVRLGSDR